MKKRTPIDYIPPGCSLQFVKQTMFSNNKAKTSNKAIYKCICGKEIEFNVDSVKFGGSKSCGCLKIKWIKHGQYHHPIYKVYRSMLQRCYDKNSSAYSRYGGIGIYVCDNWKDDFMSFFNWAISNGWQKGLQLDKDIKAKALGIKATIYSPSMCQFVTPKKNSNSRRNNTAIEYNGIRKNLCEWSEYFNINQGTLSGRLQRGWPFEQAIKISTVKTGKTKCFH